MAKKGKFSNKRKLDQTSGLWRKKKVDKIIKRDFNVPFFGPDDVNLNSTTSGSVIVSSGGTVQSVPDELFGVAYVYGNVKPPVHEVHEKSSSEKTTKGYGGKFTTRKISSRGSSIRARDKQ
jgi:hypothetical protein